MSVQNQGAQRGNNTKNRRLLVTKGTRKYTQDEASKFARSQFAVTNNLEIKANPRSETGYTIYKKGKAVSNNMDDIGKGYFKNDTLQKAGRKVTIDGREYTTTGNARYVRDSQNKLIDTHRVAAGFSDKNKFKSDNNTRSYHMENSSRDKGARGDMYSTTKSKLTKDNYKAITKALTGPKVYDFTNRQKVNSNTSTQVAQKHYAAKVVKDRNTVTGKDGKSQYYKKGDAWYDAKTNKAISNIEDVVTSKELRSKGFSPQMRGNQSNYHTDWKGSETKGNGRVVYEKTTTGGYADRTRDPNTGKVANWKLASKAELDAQRNKAGDNSYYNAKNIRDNISRGTYRESNMKEQGLTRELAWQKARNAGALQFKYGNGMYNTRTPEEENNLNLWINNMNAAYAKNGKGNVVSQDFLGSQVIDVRPGVSGASAGFTPGVGTITRPGYTMQTAKPTTTEAMSYGSGRGTFNDNPEINGIDDRQMIQGTDGQYYQSGKTGRFGTGANAEGEGNAYMLRRDTNADFPAQNQLADVEVTPNSYANANRGSRRIVPAATPIAMQDMQGLTFEPKEFQLQSKIPAVQIKYQAGGQVNQKQQIMQQIAQMIQQAGPEQAVQALVQQGAPQELAVAMVQEVMQAMGGTPSARRGAKLNYLLTLNNPNYFKKGGKVCPKCEEMKKKNKKLAKGGISDAVNAFKSSRSK